MPGRLHTVEVIDIYNELCLKFAFVFDPHSVLLFRFTVMQNAAHGSSDPCKATTEPLQSTKEHPMLCTHSPPSGLVFQFVSWVYFIQYFLNPFVRIKNARFCYVVIQNTVFDRRR